MLRFKPRSILHLLVLILTASGCASVYKPIDPPRMEYITEKSTSDIDFWYRYEALAYRGNNKYVKREKKYGYNVIAVKVVNKTNQPINFARDLELSTARGPIYPAENETTAKTIKQGVAIYLLYGLLTYSESKCTNGDCETTTIIPFGLGIAAGNMIVASTANTSIKKEFNDYSLYTKTIAPGETAYGIVCLRDIGYQPLSLKLKKRED
jgi:hypothetical protein